MKPRCDTLACLISSSLVVIPRPRVPPSAHTSCAFPPPLSYVFAAIFCSGFHCSSWMQRGDQLAILAAGVVLHLPSESNQNSVVLLLSAARLLRRRSHRCCCSAEATDQQVASHVAFFKLQASIKLQGRCACLSRPCRLCWCCHASAVQQVTNTNTNSSKPLTFQQRRTRTGHAVPSCRCNPPQSEPHPTNVRSASPCAQRRISAAVHEAQRDRAARVHRHVFLERRGFSRGVYLYGQSLFQVITNKPSDFDTNILKSFAVLK
jgi:hypothetical protein